MVVLPPSSTRNSLFVLLCALVVGTLAFQPLPRVQQQQQRRPSAAATIFRAAKPWWKVWAAENGDMGNSTDITATPAFLAKKRDVLAKELEGLAAELEGVKAEVAAEEEEGGPQRERLTTEFAFLQQRTFNESRDAEVNARVAVVKELLPIIDNFDRAKANIKPEGAEQEAIVEYYNGCFARIDELLEGFDLETVPSVGTEFDYNLHEAIQQVPSEEYDADIVCQEYQKGYAIQGKLIRPAIVAVSLGS